MSNHKRPKNGQEHLKSFTIKIEDPNANNNNNNQPGGDSNSPGNEDNNDNDNEVCYHEFSYQTENDELPIM